MTLPPPSKKTLDSSCYKHSFRALPSQKKCYLCHNMNNNPIGVFDSGMGGLSVWRELRRRLPAESIAYYGDGANCPYGEKPPHVVLTYIEDGVRTLLEHNAKLIVIACNTATMTAVKYLRQKYDLPIVGMEPALKPAALSTQTGVVGVLATQATLNSDWFDALRSRYDADVRIVSAVGHGFVEAVENGRETAPETRRLVEEALQPIIAAGADRIVLGCTHYPFLADRIAEVVSGTGAMIIDPAPAVARHTQTLLNQFGLAADDGHFPQFEFFSAAGSDYVDRLRRKADSLSN